MAADVDPDAEDLREHFSERAGILECDAGLPRAEAELEAAQITATYARNKAYLWASLRAAFAGYPALLAVLPDKAGPVDILPLGVLSWRRLGVQAVANPTALLSLLGKVLPAEITGKDAGPTSGDGAIRGKPAGEWLESSPASTSSMEGDGAGRQASA